MKKPRKKHPPRKPIAPPTLVMGENKRKNKYRRKGKFEKGVEGDETEN